MQLDADSLRDQIPYYLTQEKQLGLTKALKDFLDRGVGDFYTSRLGDELLQGDGWGSVPIVDYNTCDFKNVRVIVLSNTCDMTNSGSRDRPNNVTVAPILSLDKYKKSLQKKGFLGDVIDDKVKAIREQSVSSVFYLPEGAGLSESIVQLDRVYNLPVSEFLRHSSGHVFTLNMFGFYLFLFKLSVHFCRFHEKVDRP